MEIESRVELEKRLDQAEQALQDLESGLDSLERTRETDEKMKGGVTQLRSECIHWYLGNRRQRAAGWHLVSMRGGGGGHQDVPVN